MMRISENTALEDIRLLDRSLAESRPVRRDYDFMGHLASSIDGLTFLNNGRFVYARTPADLYAAIDPSRERLPTVPELMAIRINAFRLLSRELPQIAQVPRLVAGKSEDLYEVIAASRYMIDQTPGKFGVWQVRLTCGSHMVRAEDEGGNDTVFFCHGNPFADGRRLSIAADGIQSDGGILYDEGALEKIRKYTPEDSRMPYADYIGARGGNFSGEGFFTNPVFLRSCGNKQLFLEYVYALQIMSCLNYYHRGMHSGWRPGEMQTGFGRPVSLGAVGEAFYPPNNSTLGHSALLLELEPAWFTSF